MKKIKTTAKSIISGTLASSILISSCIKEYNIDENSIYGNLSENKLNGNPFLGIKDSNLSEEFFSTARNVGLIIEDITSNSSAAELFCSSPAEYLKDKNISLKLKLTDKDILILKSLTDDEIKNAIAQKDLRKFIRLCKKKGYINLESSVSIRASRNMFKDENAYNDYITTLSHLQNSTELNEAWFIPAAVVAIAYAVVLLYAAAYVDVAYYAGAVYKIAVATKSEIIAKDMSSINKTPVVKLWLDSNEGKLDFDIMHSELIINQAEEISQIMKEEGLCSDKSISKEIILTNLEAYYGLRK